MMHNILPSNKILLTTLLGLSLLSACKQKEQAPLFAPSIAPTGVLTFADPMIGTGGHGHTFPGATTPFGMVQLSPDTYNDTWDWCSGYHYSDSSIMGFSHTHLSGTGRGDLLDILVMPMMGKLHTEPGSRENPDEGYRSRFSHQEESAFPGYYAVLLQDYNIQAELTTTPRAGFHRYSFHEAGQAHIIIDLAHGRVGDTVKLSGLEVVNDHTIRGYRFSKGWGKGNEKYWCNQKVFFQAEFSKPFQQYGTVENGEISPESKTSEGKATKGYVSFDVAAGEEILVKVAISAVDQEGAANNLAQEITDWDFEGIRKKAGEMWAAKLDDFTLKGPLDQKETFYTAVYHSLIAPNLYVDADGRYRGSDDEIHSADGFTNYTTFSLWDTFRASHPLFTFITPEQVDDMIRSMLAQYQEYGLLPVWSLYSSETNCMIGYHAVPVIYDAFQKGIEGFNAEVAYEAMKASAMQDDFGIYAMKKYSYLPADLENKSVSKTLEYAFDDWCIAQMANALGKEDDYRYFMDRAMGYRYVHDPSDNFMKGHFVDGSVAPGFNPTYASYGKSDYVEGNAWQYSFFVPHDVQGLINLMGGRERFVAKMDSLFTQKPELAEDAPHDITGLIGQYAHGNEPSHHVAYLYVYAQQAWKTQARVHQIMTELYDNTPEGLSGNEDCGQMSAWYIFSAMGFYPVNPAEGIYVFGKPLFEELSLAMPTGKTLTVKANNLSDENIYIASVTWNGQAYAKPFIEHERLLEGGTLVFNMSSSPAEDAFSEILPPSVSSKKK